MSDKKRIIEDAELTKDTLCSYDEITGEIKKLKSRDDEIIALTENFVNRSASEEMSQDDFKAKYKAYDDEHQEIARKIEEFENEISSKKVKAKYMDSFISDLKTRPLVLEEWNDDVWWYLVDKAIVYRDASIKFLFKNGKEIAVK